MRAKLADSSNTKGVGVADVKLRADRSALALAI